MMEPPISQLMMQSNIGRHLSSKSALMVAQYYRVVVASLIVVLLLTLVPWVGDSAIIIYVALFGYALYLLIRYTLIQRTEHRFYTGRMQFWRAQIALIGVTMLMFFLGREPTIRILWVLYLPALLMISRYTDRQAAYALTIVEVSILLCGVVLITDPQITNLPTLFSIAVSPLAGLLLSSFLVHYMTRVDVTNRHGARERDELVTKLLRQVLVGTDGLQLWWTIQAACGQAISATRTALYLFDETSATVRQLYRIEERAFLGMTKDLAQCHHVEHAIVERKPQELIDKQSTCVFLPIYSQLEDARAVLAVLEIEYQPYSTGERTVTTHFLTALLQQIWPLCAYASFRHEIPALTTIVDGSIHRLQVTEVLDSVLEMLCAKIGFTFATISLVDEDQQEIRTIRGRNVPPGWVQDSHHPLDSHDIQADVLRTGKTEIIADWDERFDHGIWNRYNHADLIRAWVPLGRLGTIEAGFYKHERRTIAPLLVELVERYAHDVTTAIENAIVYERELRLAQALTSLHNLSNDLSMLPRNGDERQLLHKIASSACELLRADLILLHPMNRQEIEFDQPIIVGNLYGDNSGLKLPQEGDNIIQVIGQNREPYYQSDAFSDPLLTGQPTGELAEPTKLRTFIARQEIRSFAGLPLLAQGRLLGVLSVNYRSRHQFLAYDQQVLSLFGQMAASVIASGQLHVEQERRRIELDLHDGVKSSMRGLIELSRTASAVMDRDPQKARRLLHEVRRAAWGILSDINIVVHDLSPGGSRRRALQEFISRDLQQLATDPNLRIDLQIDSDLPSLPHRMARVLLFIAREAVANVHEHAHAGCVTVHLYAEPHTINLRVIDNGIGFPVNGADSLQHRGLASMKERARQAGGLLQIESGSKGTIVAAWLPREESDDANP